MKVAADGFIYVRIEKAAILDAGQTLPADFKGGHVVREETGDFIVCVGTIADVQKAIDAGPICAGRVE